MKKDYKRLEALITNAIKEKANKFTPGNNWIVGTNNRVPEMIAKICIDTVKGYDNESR